MKKNGISKIVFTALISLGMVFAFKSGDVHAEDGGRELEMVDMSKGITLDKESFNEPFYNLNGNSVIIDKPTDEEYDYSMCIDKDSDGVVDDGEELINYKNEDCGWIVGIFNKKTNSPIKITILGGKINKLYGAYVADIVLADTNKNAFELNISGGESNHIMGLQMTNVIGSVDCNIKNAVCNDEFDYAINSSSISGKVDFRIHDSEFKTVHGIYGNCDIGGDFFTEIYNTKIYSFENGNSCRFKTNVFFDVSSRENEISSINPLFAATVSNNYSFYCYKSKINNVNPILSSEVYGDCNIYFNDCVCECIQNMPGCIVDQTPIDNFSFIIKNSELKHVECASNLHVKNDCVIYIDDDCKLATATCVEGFYSGFYTGKVLFINKGKVMDDSDIGKYLHLIDGIMVSDIKPVIAISDETIKYLQYTTLPGDVRVPYYYAYKYDNIKENIGELYYVDILSASSSKYKDYEPVNPFAEYEKEKYGITGNGNKKPENDPNKKPDDDPDNKAGNNPNPNTKKDEAAAVGSKLVDSKSQVSYVVTSDKKGAAEVSFNSFDNSKATSVVVPESVKIGNVTYKVTKISKNAFANNKKLKSIKIANSVKVIEKKAFYGCTKLATVTINAKKSALTTIGEEAFAGCVALKSINLPAGVKKIGKKAFYGDKKLAKINISTTKLTKKNVGKNAFGNINKKSVVKVPKKSFESYKKLLASKGMKKTVTFKKAK